MDSPFVPPDFDAWYDDNTAFPVYEECQYVLPSWDSHGLDTNHLDAVQPPQTSRTVRHCRFQGESDPCSNVEGVDLLILNTAQCEEDIHPSRGDSEAIQSQSDDQRWDQFKQGHSGQAPHFPSVTIPVDHGVENTTISASFQRSPMHWLRNIRSPSSSVVSEAGSSSRLSEITAITSAPSRYGSMLSSAPSSTASRRRKRKRSADLDDGIRSVRQPKRSHTGYSEVEEEKVKIEPDGSVTLSATDLDGVRKFFEIMRVVTVHESLNGDQGSALTDADSNVKGLSKKAASSLGFEIAPGRSNLDDQSTNVATNLLTTSAEKLSDQLAGQTLTTPTSGPGSFTNHLIDSQRLKSHFDSSNTHKSAQVRTPRVSSSTSKEKLSRQNQSTTQSQSCLTEHYKDDKENNVRYNDDDDDEEEDDCIYRTEAYLEALRYFGVGCEQDENEEPDSQSTPYSDDTSGSSTALTVPSSATTNTTTANSSTGGEPVANETGSSNSSQPQVETQTQAELEFAPVPLVCWHAAIGISCKQKCGRSPEARRLLEGQNSHKLPPACQRCGLLFETGAQAQEHKRLLQSNPPCPTFSEEEVLRRNTPLERIGISQDRETKVKNARIAFRKKRLPPDCSPEFFQMWVNKNTPLYIGKSKTSANKAALELSNWLIIFCTLFPGLPVPSTPFLDASSKLSVMHSRVLELAETGIRTEIAQGVLPPELTGQHVSILLTVFKESLEKTEAEALQEQSWANKPKGPSRKRARLDVDHDVNSADTAPNHSLFPPTPAPPLPTPTFETDYHARGTFTQPTPGSTMGPPPTPAYSDYQSPAAATGLSQRDMFYPHVSSSIPQLDGTFGDDMQQVANYNLQHPSVPEQSNGNAFVFSDFVHDPDKNMELR